jgi:hypothetical protein
MSHPYGKNPKKSISSSVFSEISKNHRFCYFWDHYFGWFLGFQKIQNFRAPNGASLQNGLVLANQNRFFLQIFFKRKITIHPSTTETFFTIFAFCCNLGSRVVTSQIVIMTGLVSNLYWFFKNSTSLTEIATEMIPTVLGSWLLVVYGKNTIFSIFDWFGPQTVISLLELQ